MKYLFYFSAFLLLFNSCNDGNRGMICIVDELVVTTGDCTSDTTYTMQIDFIAENPGNDFFELYDRDNEVIGFFELDDLPITIADYHSIGTSEDYVKVCINDNPDCCEVVGFLPPDCSSVVCLINELTVDVGECASDSTYAVTIDFNQFNAGVDSFDVYVRNNELIGTYDLNDLPLTITDFAQSGLEYDFLEVCIHGNPDCCASIEFMPQDCEPEPCDIFDLVVDVGDCTSDSTYAVTIDFEHANAGSFFFEVYTREDVLLGFYELDDLPVTINDFEPGGSDFDFIEVCINDVPDCCAATEFMPPDCEPEPCDIFDLNVSVGECTSDSTYAVTIDFEHANAGNSFFELYSSGNQLLGLYELANLPLTISQFETSGNDLDYIKVCINNMPDCCAEIEFTPPDCEPEPCGIFDLNVSVGECTSDSTYAVTIDFEHANAGNDFFEVYLRENVLLGTYALNDLPVTINDFEPGGSDFDFIEVCVNDNPDCCASTEFMPPDCEPEPCDIFDLNVIVGECTSDSTYAVTLDFMHANAGNDLFEVYLREDVLLGTYALNDLPVTINDFEPSGSDFDFIEVCINDVPDCCAATEFMPPDCEPEPCGIGEIMFDIRGCTSDTTYNVVIDFDYAHVTDEHFNVFVRNDIHIGFYALADLPVTLQDFELSGFDSDFIKVCINDNADCCSETEYLAPVCP